MRKGWLLLLFLLVLTPEPVFADSALDNMLPSHSPANDPENELYEQFDIEAYHFDGYYPGGVGLIQETLNFMFGWGMVMVALTVKMGIYLYQLGYKIPGFKTLARAVSDLVEQLGGTFFDALLHAGFTIMGVYILFELIRRRYADSMKEVGKSLLLLSLASLLFNNMYTVFTQVDDFSSKAGDEIVLGMNSVNKKEGEEGEEVSTEPGKEAMVETSNQIWRNFVIIPWQLGEFGETMKDPNAKISPKSKDPIAQQTYKMLNEKDPKKRNDYTEALVKVDENAIVSFLKDIPLVGGKVEELEKHFKNVFGTKKKKDASVYSSMTGWGGLMSRGTITFFAFIGVVIFIPLLLVLSLFVAGYSIGFLLLGGLAAFIFLYALWPKGGIWSIVNWFQQWLGAGLYKIVAVFLLSLYLLLSTKLYTIFRGWGWFGSVVIQIALLILIIVKHKKVFQILKRPMTQARNFTQNLNRQTPKEIQNRAERWAREKAKAAEELAMKGAGVGIRSGKAMYQGGKAYLQSYLMGSSGSKQRPPRYAEPTRNKNTNWQETPDGLYRRGGAPQGSAPRGMIGGTTNRAIPATTAATRRQTALPVSSPAPMTGNGITYVPTHGSIQNGRIVNGQKYERVKAVMKDERTKAAAKAVGKVAVRAGIKVVTKI
ncbi:hypothetical protein ACFQ5F_09895 [Kroppenstedtia eburnea]|uniref:hypothetical protein n=1 Tax=Kroppenstedtia eburnea TaxID=714067 RepID=UPI0036455301